MTDCQVCKELPSKYTCPNCEWKTCSLKCVKAHKILIGCTGIKKKTKYVPILNYSAKTMVNDLNYMNVITRGSDLAHRELVKLGKRDNRKRFSYLLSACKDRGLTM
jgi:hypothetical protein